MIIIVVVSSENVYYSFLDKGSPFGVKSHSSAQFPCHGVCAGVGFDPFYCTLMLYSTCLAVTGDFISETAHKAAVAKRLQKAQREAALEAVKMAKRERGFYKIPIFVGGYGMNFSQKNPMTLMANIMLGENLVILK